MPFTWILQFYYNHEAKLSFSESHTIFWKKIPIVEDDEYIEPKILLFILDSFDAVAENAHSLDDTTSMKMKNNQGLPSRLSFTKALHLNWLLVGGAV